MILNNSEFILCEGSVSGVVKLQIVRIKLVSSTYMIGLKDVQDCARSFMYIRKSREPSIDSWGTPVVILRTADLVSLISKYCVLSEM